MKFRFEHRYCLVSWIYSIRKFHNIIEPTISLKPNMNITQYVALYFLFRSYNYDTILCWNKFLIMHYMRLNIFVKCHIITSIFNVDSDYYICQTSWTPTWLELPKIKRNINDVVNVALFFGIPCYWQLFSYVTILIKQEL